MALHDDPLMVLRHLRQSFVKGDESGLCEEILASSSQHDCDSPPIVVNRRASLSSQPSLRSMKSFDLAKTRKTIRSHHWGDPRREDLEPLRFTPEEVILLPPAISAIAAALEEANSSENNFSEFGALALHTGVSRDAGVRKLVLYLLLPGVSVSAPPSVAILCSSEATVRQMSGLALFLHTRDAAEPNPLVDKSTVDEYRVMMCDGSDVDWGMPPFNGSDKLSRFSFTSLAVVHSSHQSADTATVTLEADFGSYTVASSTYDEPLPRPGAVEASRHSHFNVSKLDS